MYNWSRLNRREKYFYLLLVVGFLTKYNYFLLRIFNSPAKIGILTKNILLIYIFMYIVLPLYTRKNWRIFILLIYTIFTIIFMTNYWYLNYFGSYLSLKDVGKGGSLLPVIEMFFLQILKPVDFLFLIDIPFLYYFHSRINEGFFVKRSRVKLSVLVIVILLLIAHIMITNITLGGYNFYQLYQLDTSGFVNVYGIGPLYLYEVYREIFPPRNQSQELSTPEAMADNTLNEDNNTEKYNLVVIQVESLDKNIISHRHQGEEITPFLNKLSTKSITATDFFAQHVNGSYNADFSFLTSFYPTSKHYIYNEMDITEFESLPRILKEEDYSTLSFVNRKTFFHRDKAFPNLGFDEFYGLGDYNEDDIEIKVKNKGLGVNDYDRFRQSVPLIEEAEEPFFAFFITSTSHGPFKYYDVELEDKFPKVKNKLLRDYYRSMLFVDQSIKMFYDKLDELELLDDTIFVVYSDHCAEIREDEYSSYGAFTMEENIKPPEKIPLFILHPDREAKKIEKPGTTTDLAPTLLDLLGYEKKPEEFVGQSLFKEEREPVLFLNEKPLVLHENILYRQEVDEFNFAGTYGAEGEGGRKELPEEVVNSVREIVDYTMGVLP